MTHLTFNILINFKLRELWQFKYMGNCYLATKVVFCSQFALLAEQCGVDYEDLRELFILDPRVNPSHTFIDRDKPYWDSHCLNKDVRAIAETFNADFLNDMIKFNENRKRKTNLELYVTK